MQACLLRHSSDLSSHFIRGGIGCVLVRFDPSDLLMCWAVSVAVRSQRHSCVHLISPQLFFKRDMPCVHNLPAVYAQCGGSRQGWQNTCQDFSILVVDAQSPRCPLHLTAQLLRAASIAEGLQLAFSTLPVCLVQDCLVYSPVVFVLVLATGLRGQWRWLSWTMARLPLLSPLLVEVRWLRTWPALQLHEGVYRPRYGGAKCLLLGHTFRKRRTQTSRVTPCTPETRCSVRVLTPARPCEPLSWLQD